MSYVLSKGIGRVIALAKNRAYTYSLTWVRCAPAGRVPSGRRTKESAFLFLDWRSSGTERSSGHQ